MYEHTEEQIDIIKTCKVAPIGTILKVEAVAGSSKTYTGTQIANAIDGTNILYLAYNKAIATEASERFPIYTQCKTTHSLAYQLVVSNGLDLEGNTGKPYSIGFLNHRGMTERVAYDYKVQVIALLEEFFVSKYTTTKDFVDNLGYELSRGIAELVETYFQKMIDREVKATHGFYLKMYHILLSKEYITYDIPFDLIILDEAGDINGVTLEVFKLLPSHLKVMMGDSLQNIYSFNHTINGFEELKGEGITKHLSQSFRCSVEIAARVERFIHKHIDKSIVFKGTHHSDKSIHTEAVISRTNSGLIKYMIDCVEEDRMFNLVRPAKEIFSLMLILLNLNKGQPIFDPQYKHLKKDADNYRKNPRTQTKYKTLVAYIDHLYSDEDTGIKVAVATIRKYGPKAVYNAYNVAVACEDHEDNHDLTLTTAHSSKGLSFDRVTIADDFKLKDILEFEKKDSEEMEELRLYYVACTRAKLDLINTKYL